MSLNKKCVTLSEMNSKFTEDVLISILSNVCNGEEVQLTDWNFNEISVKGDNYMSDIYKGKVHGIINNNPKRHVQANVIVKSMPKSPGIRKTLRCADFFCNEIAFYTQIIPKFEKFLAEKEKSDLLSIPRHIISSTDSENGYVILEDATCLGFHALSRQNCLDWAECSAALKTLSKFHAISFAYKDQKKEFAKMIDCLKETVFSREYWNWYKGYHEKTQVLIKHALVTEYPGSKAEKQYNSYKSDAFFDKCAELCNRRHAPTSVVIEGDCWVPNLLIRDIGKTQKQALILDFQLSRCASPITDLSFLIYACTLKSFRDQYFDEMLKMYHSELSNVIRLLGSDPEKLYPWDVFMKEVKEQFVFGVYASMIAIPLCLMDIYESFVDTAVKSDEAIDIGDAVSSSYIATASGRQRLADVIVHAVEKGYI